MTTLLTRASARPVIAVGAAVIALTATPALGVRQAVAPPQLAGALSAWTATYPATSVVAWRLDADEPVEVLSYAPLTPRRPASTMKIVTASAALLALSPEFRFETQLYAGASSTLTDGVLSGPVYLRGSGDPTLATQAYAARYRLGPGRLRALVRPLQTLGVTRINGPLVVDETLFDARRNVATWPSRYGTECQPLSAVSVNQSYLGNRRGKYVKRPPIAAGVHTRIAMSAAGVTLGGKIVTGRTPTQGRLLATTTSPPLRAIVRMMLPDSDNFIAETLTKNIGAYGPGTGTTAGGTAHAASLLRGKGILEPVDRLEDGSGLGLANRLTATSLTRLMAAASGEPEWGAALIAGLPRGGEGTLKRRLVGLGGRVRAKTGYIRRTSTLAGIVDSVGGARYAFAILMNEGPLTDARATQDRIVALLGSGIADTA